MTKSKYTKQLLEPIVKDSLSWAQVLRKLNLKPTGGNYSSIKKHVLRHDLSTTHFTGQRWNKGLTQLEHPSLQKASESLRIPDTEVFTLNGHQLDSGKIAKRLLNHYNWPNVCSICGLDSWQNKPITLDLDHINGNNRDNSFENLQLLCPNCHRQTPTWGNKKRA